MTQDEIIEMPEYLNAAYEGDDLYTGDQVRELMKLVAEKAFQDGYSIGEAAGFKQAIKLERARGEA